MFFLFIARLFSVCQKCNHWFSTIQFMLGHWIYVCFMFLGLGRILNHQICIVIRALELQV
jgi:hypothetical protein